MSRDKIDSLFLDTIASLKAATDVYETFKGDGGLPPAFHGAGQRFGLVQQAFEIIQGQPIGAAPAGKLDNVIQPLENASRKSKTIEDIFRQVAPPPETSRLARYRAAVAQRGVENAVETLVIGLLKDACGLVGNGAGGGATEPQLQGLREAIDELSAMEPPVPGEGLGNHFYHSGSGAQINNTGTGTQYNNTGEGSQYHAEVMQFGK